MWISKDYLGVNLANGDTAVAYGAVCDKKFATITQQAKKTVCTLASRFTTASRTKTVKQLVPDATEKDQNVRQIVTVTRPEGREMYILLVDEADREVFRFLPEFREMN